MAGNIELMQRALAEAARGRGRTSPNPMVGCVVAKGKRVLAVGYHRRAGGAHAEGVALKRAGKAARGADVYVNLEPCAHSGRTGPCTEALIASAVRRVFVGMRDPHPLVNGRGLRALRRAGIEVEVGLCANEARRLNEAFEFAVGHGRPFVAVKIAQSLDGRVATRTGESKWITGEKARAAGHRLRNELDAIVVGVGTVLADDPRLTCRTRGGRDPVRIIVDTHGRTPTTARVVRGAKRSKAPTWIVVGADVSAAKRRALKKAGAQVIECKTKNGHVDPQAMLAVIYERQLRSVLVEGGPSLIGSFFDDNLVNKVHVFVAPVVIGGEAAKSSVGAQGIAELRDGWRLTDVGVEHLGADLHIVGYPRRR